MISNKNKRLEITLTLDEVALLDSLASRFNITRTQVIKQSLKLFASARKHAYSVYMKPVKETIPEETEETEETWEELTKDCSD